MQKQDHENTLYLALICERLAWIFFPMVYKVLKGSACRMGLRGDDIR